MLVTNLPHASHQLVQHYAQGEPVGGRTVLVTGGVYLRRLLHATRYNRGCKMCYRTCSDMAEHKHVQVNVDEKRIPSHSMECVDE